MLSTKRQARNTILYMSISWPIVIMCQPEPYWLAKERVLLLGGLQILNIKRNLTSVFVNRYLPYSCV